ncbi:hypothetical protein EVAR_65115_1 [Eumeta japonica]|uniref:Uncharacterized protein n=1 Tax=Eumeta variegata TaxID=151549 RepID=A0A4C1Z978_EUMVA|nr:hypothetical protein EVAR_65115_1 [Eumeta japonica]
MSTALEEIDTPALNNIPDIIETTDEVDTSIGTLTNYIQKVVKSCSREFPVTVDHRRLPADALDLLANAAQAKNAALCHASHTLVGKISSERGLFKDMREPV